MKNKKYIIDEELLKNLFEIEVRISALKTGKVLNDKEVENIIEKRLLTFESMPYENK